MRKQAGDLRGTEGLDNFPSAVATSPDVEKGTMVHTVTLSWVPQTFVLHAPAINISEHTLLISLHLFINL